MTKPVVLIVEDEAPLVTMLRYNLEKEGFQVCEASDGEDALIQISERKPDIVLLDWMLPLVSGLEVCRKIRDVGDGDTPVMMLTVPRWLISRRREPGWQAGLGAVLNCACGTMSGPRHG